MLASRARGLKDFMGDTWHGAGKRPRTDAPTQYTPGFSPFSAGGPGSRVARRAGAAPGHDAATGRGRLASDRSAGIGGNGNGRDARSGRSVGARAGTETVRMVASRRVA